MAEDPLERIKARLETAELTCRYLLYAMRGEPDLPPVDEMRRIVGADDEAAAAPPATRRRRTEPAQQTQSYFDRVDIPGTLALTEKGPQRYVSIPLNEIQGEQDRLADFEKNFNFKVDRRNPQYLVFTLMQYVDRIDISQADIAGALLAGIKNYPGARPLIVHFVTPGVTLEAFPRWRYLTNITNIPILFYRLDDTYTKARSMKELKRDNRVRTFDNKPPKTIHEVYEGLEALSGARPQ